MTSSKVVTCLASFRLYSYEVIFFGTLFSVVRIGRISCSSSRESHFATIPDTLIVDCVKAGYPPGGVVLDPFIGSGTTATVSLKNDRRYVGIELNSEYVEIIHRRVSKVSGN